MDLSSDSFWKSILELDSTLVQRIKQKEKITEFSDEHKILIKELLLSAARSSEWPDIAGHISFLIYAGSVHNYLFSEVIDNKLNPLIKLHNDREFTKIFNARKGGIAKAAKSIETKEKVISAWQSGKYTSKDICAEQESADTGYSFSAVRKWLRNK